MQTELGQSLASHDVVSWRCDQLVRSGFAQSLAARLAADRRYDLHGLIELIERGCAPELSVRILAPLESRTPREC